MTGRRSATRPSTATCTAPRAAGRPLPPPAEGPAAARVPPRPQAAQRLDPARALDREPAGRGREPRDLRPLGGRPADLRQAGRQGERDLAGGAQEPLHLPAAERGQALDGGGSRASPRRSGPCPRTPAGRSPSTAAASSPPTPARQRPGGGEPTSVTRTAPGRRAPSRTRTAASAASCRATASPRRSPAPACGGSPTGSTTRPGAASATAPRARSSEAAPGGPDRPALTSPRTRRTSRRNRHAAFPAVLLARSAPTGVSPAGGGHGRRRPRASARNNQAAPEPASEAAVSGWRRAYQPLTRTLAISAKCWRPLGDSNPCFRRERASYGR